MDSEITSLKELSLRNIIENFSRHTTAFALREDEILEHNLNFLRMLYSRDLFSLLAKEGKLEEDHLYFLLNEYLRKLEIFSLLRCSCKEKIVEKVIPIAHSIDELVLSSFGHLDYMSCSPENAKFVLRNLIPYLVNVKKIIIPNICDEYILEVISMSCSLLEELDIKCSYWLDYDNVSSNAISYLLKNLPNLELFICRNLPVAVVLLFERESQNMSSENYFLNLTRLDFTGYDLSSEASKALVICSEMCPKVKFLAVNITNEDQLELARRFPNLENIFLNCIAHLQSQSPMNVDNFLVLTGKKLKHSCILNFSLSISTLIKSCPNLCTIKLVNNRYQASDENSAELLNHLRSLQFSYHSIHGPFCKDSVLRLLKSCPQLEGLTFFKCDLRESNFEAKLSKLNLSLKHLKFLYCDVSVSLIKKCILNFVTIENLTVHYCNDINSNEFSILRKTILVANKKTKTNFLLDTFGYSVVVPHPPSIYDFSDCCMFCDIDKHPRWPL